MNTKGKARVAWLILILFRVIELNCQIRPYSVGERIPDGILHKIGPAYNQVLPSSAIKNKYLIIYFWHTQCGACVRKIPDLAALQEKYGDSLQVLMVGKQDSSEVNYFFSRRKDLTRLRLPIITNDSILSAIFPYEGNPHVVWIGRDKVVKAITGGEEVLAANVNRMISTNTLNLPVKYDVFEDISGAGVPLVVDIPGINTSIKFLSMLSGAINSLKPGNIGIDKSNPNFLVLRAINVRLHMLYAHAYSTELAVSNKSWDKKVVNRIKVNNPFLSRDDGELFCYELRLARSSVRSYDNATIKNFMQADLDHLFGIHSSVKNLRRQCFILKPVRPTLFDNYTRPEGIVDYVDSTSLENVDPRVLASKVQSIDLIGLPVIFEGVVKEGISITLMRKYSSYKELKRDLRRKGFVLKKGRRSIRTLVFE